MSDKIDLWYFRCKWCLSAMTFPESDLDRRAGCICGGQIEFMGQVTENHSVVKEEVRSACDERCTSALGPKCVCKCGSRNHGTGLVVVIEHQNGIAFVKPMDDEAMVRGKESYGTYKLMEGIGEQKLGAILEKNRRHIWLLSTEYQLLKKYRKALKDAVGGRVHKTRMKKMLANIDWLRSLPEPGAKGENNG